VDEDESLQRYGLHPRGESLDEVRELLSFQAAKERAAQGRGDVELMKLCCVQLFNAGELRDVLSIWRAKTASMDAHCSIEVQLLCGAGLAETKAFLAGQSMQEAEAALRRLTVDGTDHRWRVCREGDSLHPPDTVSLITPWRERPV
jgi:hypothetical protein